MVYVTCVTHATIGTDTFGEEACGGRGALAGFGGSSVEELGTSPKNGFKTKCALNPMEQSHDLSILHVHLIFSKQKYWTSTSRAVSWLREAQ